MGVISKVTGRKMRIKTKENDKVISQTYNLSETATDEQVFAVGLYIDEIITPTVTGIYRIIETELMDI